MGTNLIRSVTHMHVYISNNVIKTYPNIYFQIFELILNGASGRYCGSVPPPVIRSVSNKLIIRFSTDAEDAGSGFNATYWHEDCKCVHHMLWPLRVISVSYHMTTRVLESYNGMD